MKWHYLLLIFSFLSFSPLAFAQPDTQIIDDNGNLKIIPRNAPSASSTPNSSPSTSNNTGASGTAIDLNPNQANVPNPAPTETNGANNQRQQVQVPSQAGDTMNTTPLTEGGTSGGPAMPAITDTPPTPVDPMLNNNSQNNSNQPAVVPQSGSANPPQAAPTQPLGSGVLPSSSQVPTNVAPPPAPPTNPPMPRPLTKLSPTLAPAAPAPSIPIPAADARPPSVGAPPLTPTPAPLPPTAPVPASGPNPPGALKEIPMQKPLVPVTNIITTPSGRVPVTTPPYPAWQTVPPESKAPANINQ